MVQVNYKFDRPIIILAAPRSGSTLLFELLAKAKNVWTINNESHAVFETIQKFNPKYGLCSSNRLEAKDADEDSINIIRHRFHSMLQDREENKYDSNCGSPRFLEKTPKNALRVPFLDKIFPDASYIFLYRNPRENISSIMDAWKSQRFITYPELNGRNSSWSLLLPPGWEKMNNRSLEEVAYYQWKMTNNTIINDLQELIPKDRWKTVSYSNVINNTEETIKDLCDFSGFEFDAILQEYCRNKLQPSRYTLSAPSPTKWHKHAEELARVLPAAKHTLKKLRQITTSSLSIDFEIGVPDYLYRNEDDNSKVNSMMVGKVSRNSTCPCGSGLKYKKCHGK